MSEYKSIYDLMCSEYVSKLDVLDMLVDYFGEYPRVPNPLLNKLDYIDPADVVEVIRCKDCKYWKDEKMIDLAKDKLVAPCNINERDSFEDDYCSYGEKKDDE